MQWSRLRDSSNPMFFPNIAAIVKRLDETERDWTKAEMVNFVQKEHPFRRHTAICGRDLDPRRSSFLPKRGEEITNHRKVIIENFMYSPRSIRASTSSRRCP